MQHGGKRGRQERGGSGKPSKKRYLHKPVSSTQRPCCCSHRPCSTCRPPSCVQPAGGNKLGIPMQSRGIMISCTSSKEQQAAREAIALFTEVRRRRRRRSPMMGSLTRPGLPGSLPLRVHPPLSPLPPTCPQSYEQLGGTWTQQAGPAAADAAADAPPTDIAAALASEVAELRGGSRQPFYYHQLGIHSVVFLECKDGGGPGPAALVQHACQRVSDSQQGAGRFCSRFYPVERTCYASMEKIEELAAQVVRDHFPADAQEPIEVCVRACVCACGVRGGVCAACWGGWGGGCTHVGGRASGGAVGSAAGVWHGRSVPRHALRSAARLLCASACLTAPPPRLTARLPAPQFAVVYDARAAPPLDRMEVINAFATRVPVSGLAGCVCVRACVEVVARREGCMRRAARSVAPLSCAPQASSCRPLVPAASRGWPPSSLAPPPGPRTCRRPTRSTWAPPTRPSW